jgi:hypothetical protein
MLERLRRPFFLIAVVLIVLIVLVEAGSSLFPDPPGLAIAYLALIDGLLLLRITIMAFALLVSDRAVSKVQGLVTIIVAILVVLVGIIMALVALALLLFMVTLILATPFGTIAYFAKFADFDRAGAAVLLSLLLTFKLLFVLFLVLAHQRFLQNKGLVLLIVTSIVANLVVAFLHGLVPRFMVSITDALAAIVLAVIAIVWAVIIGILSIPAVIRALRVDRAAT